MNCTTYHITIIICSNYDDIDQINQTIKFPQAVNESSEKRKCTGIIHEVNKIRFPNKYMHEIDA